MAIGERFDIRAGYLNTASIGVPPVRAADVAAHVSFCGTGAAV
jgi:hypothetical protein